MWMAIATAVRIACREITRAELQLGEFLLQARSFGVRVLSFGTRKMGVSSGRSAS